LFARILVRNVRAFPLGLQVGFIEKFAIVSKEYIRIGGAREHNLKNLTLNIPRDKLVVITGLSGSGKSSLAFDDCHRATEFGIKSALNYRHDHRDL
jgi:hypothetical protein